MPVGRSDQRRVLPLLGYFCKLTGAVSIKRHAIIDVPVLGLYGDLLIAFNLPGHLLAGMVPAVRLAPMHIVCAVICTKYRLWSMQVIEIDTAINPPPRTPTPDLRQLTHVVYALYAIGFLTSGFFAVATFSAVVVMYLKRGDAAGTVYAAHYEWLLRTFCWALLWCAIGFILTFILIGWAVLLATIVWVVYRIARGWLALLDGRVPNHYA